CSHSSCTSFALYFLYFFFTATTSTEIYTLSLHDALPIFLDFLNGDFDGPVDAALESHWICARSNRLHAFAEDGLRQHGGRSGTRSEEHTSELQSPYDLVCRLLLEKKNKPRIRLLSACQHA